MKEQWVSAKRAKKLFNLDAEGLAKLEKEGKVQIMLMVGNKKLYLLESFEEIPQNKTLNIISKVLSWFKFKGK